MKIPCTLCNERTGYKELNNHCTRCATINELYHLAQARDEAELRYNSLSTLIYRIEIYEGLRPPPARPGSHDVQGDPAIEVSSERKNRSAFSPRMKQGSGPLTEDDLT